jgi:hypothetical protein
LHTHIMNENLEFAQSSAHGNYYYKVMTDTDPSNPREDFDGLGTMICFHRNYLLGDQKEAKQYSDREDFIFSLSGIDTYSDYYIRKTDKMSDSAVYQMHMDEARKRNLILPLYLYDHGGISISCSSFNDPWDSGQVGWIYVSHEKIRKEYSWKNLTAARIAQIEGYLKGEVKVYDDYLTGDVYGYKIYSPVGDDFDPDETDIEDVAEEISSCWGFYGSNDSSGLKDDVMSYVKYDIKVRDEKLKKDLSSHFEQLKAWIRNKVNIMYRKPLQIA